MKDSGKQSRFIFALQIASLSWIWIFVTGITWWIIRLITVSISLKDAINASVMISIIVIPIFIALASILTYVFVGLQRNKVDTGDIAQEGLRNE